MFQWSSMLNQQMAVPPSPGIACLASEENIHFFLLTRIVTGLALSGNEIIVQ